MVSSQTLAALLSTEAPRSLGRQVARGTLWTTAQSFVMRLSGLLVFLVLARLLLPEQFGLVAAAQVFVALSRVLAEYSMTRTLVQRAELRAAHLDSALLISGGMGLLLSIVLLAAAPWVAGLYDMPDLTPILVALAVVPFLSGLASVPESILRRQLRFREVAMRGMVSVVLGGVVGIVLALLGAGVWALVAQTISQVVIALLMLQASVRWMPGRAWERAAMAELMGFGAHVVAISLLNFFNRRAGELIIGIALGPVALGLFTVAMKALMMGLDLIVKSVNKVALPVLSRVAHDPARLTDAYLRLTGFTALVAFPGFTLLALFGDRLTPLVFGAQWGQAGPVLAILALLGPVHSVKQSNSIVMLATGAARIALVWTAVGAACNVVATVIVVQFGVEAVAAAYVVVAWTLLPLGLYLVRRAAGVSIRGQLNNLVVPLVGCAVMALTVVGFEAGVSLGSSAEAIIAGSLGVLGYTALVLPFRKKLLMSTLRQFRSRAADSPHTEPAVGD